MTVFLLQLGTWLAKKLLLGLFIALVGLGCYALYLYVQENFQIQIERVELLETLKEEQASLVELAVTAETEVRLIRENLEASQQKAEMARRLIASLEEVQSFWNWLFSDAEEEKKIEERKVYAEGVREEQLATIEGFELRLNELGVSTELNLARLTEVEAGLAELEEGPPSFISYAEKAWEKIQIPLLAALFLFFFGSGLWSLFCYYGLASWLTHCRSIELVEIL